jgi:hypothetical protein
MIAQVAIVLAFTAPWWLTAIAVAAALAVYLLGNRNRKGA